MLLDCMCTGQPATKRTTNTSLTPSFSCPDGFYGPNMAWQGGRQDCDGDGDGDGAGDGDGDAAAAAAAVRGLGPPPPVVDTQRRSAFPRNVSADGAESDGDGDAEVPPVAGGPEDKAAAAHPPTDATDGDGLNDAAQQSTAPVSA